MALKALLKQFWSEKLEGNSACCSEGALKRRLCISSDASLVRDEFFQHGVNKYSHSSQYPTPSLFGTRRSETRKEEKKKKKEMHAVLRFHPVLAATVGLLGCAALTSPLHYICFLSRLPRQTTRCVLHPAPPPGVNPQLHSEACSLPVRRPPR